MGVAIKKLEGVADVNVSLSKGIGTIQLKPGNKVTLGEIRKGVEGAGVTPKEATAKLTGQLDQQNGTLRIKVPETNELFEIASVQTAPQKSEEVLKQMVGQQLKFVIVIPEAKGGTQPPITIRDFWK